MSWTKEQKREYNRLYYQKHRDELLPVARERTRVWYANNSERSIQASTKWAKKHPERRKETVERFYSRHNHTDLVTAWRKANPEKARRLARRYVVNRRARLAGAPGQWTNEQWHARCDFYGWRCFYCRAQLSELTITVDHRIPLSRGGSNWPSNLVPACKSCNSKKGARTSHAKLPRA